MTQEVLVGKCNVICTSKDERNPQPSEEDIKMADYIFFRTFDVGNCAISDYIKDEVGGIEGILFLRSLFGMLYYSQF